MATYKVEYRVPSVPPIKQHEVSADEYEVKGDFIDFKADNDKVFTVRADVVITIAQKH